VKILAVEDDSIVTEKIRSSLASCSFTVDIVGEEAARDETINVFEYDLILLNACLPNASSIQLYKQWRHQGLQVPILLLPQLEEATQQAIASNSGAKDSLERSFDEAELVNRVRSLLQSPSPRKPQTFLWGQLKLNQHNRTISYGSHPIEANSKEYAILELLLQHPQRIFSAQTILERAWTALASPRKATVWVQIKKIRKKLTKAGAPLDLIKTVQGTGYQLNPLYSDFLGPQTEPELANSPMADLDAANEKLRQVSQQLQATQEELRQKTQELAAANQTIEQERQALQSVQNELEQRVEERTAELLATNQSLQQQQQQFQALFDYALDAILIADNEGRYLDANPTACELFGVSKAQLLKSSVAHFADPTLDVAQLWQVFLQQGHLAGEFSVHRPDGMVRQTEFAAIAHFIPNRHLSILRDISDRKQVEADRQQAIVALENSERRLATLMDNLPGYVYRVANDLHYTPEFISKGVFNVTGHTQEEYLIDRTITCGQEMHPDDVDPVWQIVQQAIAAQQPYECEYRIITKTGTEKWVWERGQGIFAEDGTLGHLEGFVTDVSDRKQSEEALCRSERTLRALFDSTFEFIGLLTPDGKVIDANRAACALVAVDPSEVIGQPFWQTPWWTHHPEQQQKLREAIAHAAQGEFVRMETRHVRADGALIDVDFSLNPVLDDDGNVVLLVPEGRDMTSLKQVEKALRQREQQYQQVLNAIPDIIFVKGPDSRLLWCNQALQDFYRMSLAEIQGIIDTPLNNPEYTRQYLQDDELVFTTGETLEIREEPITRHDGTIRIFNTSKAPIFNDQGEVIMLVGVARDITARRQAETALEQQLTREKLVAEVSQEIRQSLHLDDVLRSAVERVRAVLETDRVAIYRFREDWYGDIIMESVGQPWNSILAMAIADPCFGDRYVEPYCQGRVHVLNDVEQANLEPCYRELLQTYQVKANLVVPILQGDNLWGLLIAHHCAAPRSWQTSEIDLLKQLATQIGIAIQQSELFEQTRRELLERQRMQQVLEESEQRFRSLSAAAPIGICQTNAEGICIYTNTRWHEMSGQSFEESLGDGWLQAVHPDDRDMLGQAWKAYLQNEQEVLPEFRLLNPQGEVRWVSAQVATIRSGTGEVIGYVTTDEDITERKLADTKIREQAALLDIASDAIFVRDLDGRIVYWNRGAEQLYGWSAAEAIGQKSNDLFQFSSIKFEEIVQTLLRNGEWQGELRKRTKKGETVTVEARWTLVRDEAQTPRFILAVNTDITEKKQLEIQFYRAQRLESLGRLASGIAHDLNNVFTPILALSQVLRLTQRQLGSKAQDQLRLLEDSARRGANLVQQMLTVTRGSTEERTPVMLAPVLWEVVQIAQESFPKNIEICPQLPAADHSDHPLGEVLADSTQLHQVFLNLLVNARDAMPEGGKLTVTATQTFVDQTFAQKNLDVEVGNYVLVTVADTGTGITPEVRDRMFDPFFTTKEPGKGTGLGLATVLGIVKNYGGFVQVSTEVGQGTQISVYLPVLEEAIGDRAPSSEAPQTSYQGNGELILIVEDDPAVQQTTQILLESHNYATLTANDGLEAIEQYTQRQTDIQLVLLDITMPKMNGVELIQRLVIINPTVKIIAISGLPQNREPTLAAGAAAFFAKPYSLGTLAQKVWELLQE